MNYVWDLNLQPFMKSTIVINTELRVGFEPAAFHYSLDYELHVGFEPIVFHKVFNCGRLWITCEIWTYSVSLQLSLDYELHVEFEYTAFHKEHNCGR